MTDPRGKGTWGGALLSLLLLSSGAVASAFGAGVAAIGDPGCPYPLASKELDCDAICKKIKACGGLPDSAGLGACLLACHRMGRAYRPGLLQRVLSCVAATTCKPGAGPDFAERCFVLALAKSAGAGGEAPELCRVIERRLAGCPVDPEWLERLAAECALHAPSLRAEVAERISACDAKDCETRWSCMKIATCDQFLPQEIELPSAPPGGEIRCADGDDDDGDGDVDCEDTDCAGSDDCAERSCSDGIDDDGDGLVDCEDPDCGGEPPCRPESACDDRLDNDHDGKTDCADDDCFQFERCGEIDCADGVDNDDDGTTDCADLGCGADVACDATTPTWPQGARPSARATAGQIWLSWPAAGDEGATLTYQITLGDDLYIVLDSETLSFPVAGLDPGTLYALGLRACDLAGHCSDERRLTATTATDARPPAWSRPGALVVLRLGPTGVLLRWPPPDDDGTIARFEVYRDGVRIKEAQVARVLGRRPSCVLSLSDPPPETPRRSGKNCTPAGGAAAPARPYPGDACGYTYVLTGLKPGVAHVFEVRACDRAGRCGSLRAGMTPPPDPAAP